MFRSVVLSAFVASVVFGQSVRGYAAEPSASGWTITLKANAGMSPAWEGSNSLSPYLAPGLGIRRAGTPLAFSAPDDSPSFALLDVGWLKAGPAGRLKGPRKASDHAELRGIHDIDWTLEAGGFFELWPVETFRVRVEARHGFLGHHGNVVDFSADWIERRGPWTVSVGPRMSIGDTRYMDQVFGVTAQDALTNGSLPIYRAGGGMKSAGVSGAISYEWSKAWTTTIYADYRRLVGSAGASPITTGLGSRDQFTVGAIAAYSFDWPGFSN